MTTKFKPPTRLYLNEIELAIHVSHERHRRRAGATEYVRAGATRGGKHVPAGDEIAAACRELLEWMRQQSIDDDYVIGPKQRLMMMRAHAALAKGRK